jgi:hypothetical protein
MSTKCFSQSPLIWGSVSYNVNECPEEAGWQIRTENYYTFDNWHTQIASETQDTLELPKQFYEKRTNGNSAFVINPVKSVTGNYTLSEDDNGVTIHLSSGNITIPIFENSFKCWVVRTGSTRPTFTGAVWRSGFTPLSVRYQAVTISALPKSQAIIY